MRGVSAYLPSYMAGADVAEERLCIVSQAPVFQRPLFIIYNDITAYKWPWFTNLIPHV